MNSLRFINGYEFIEFTINNEFKSWKSVLNALSTLYPIFGFVDSLSYL